MHATAEPLERLCRPFAQFWSLRSRNPANLQHRAPRLTISAPQTLALVLSHLVVAAPATCAAALSPKPFAELSGARPDAVIALRSDGTEVRDKTFTSGAHH